MAQIQPEACCNTPAVKIDYKEKGSFTKVNGLETYHTGPKDATTAILVVPDIFGYSSQTLQGADILAHADGKDHQYQVFIPDFFEGDPASTEWYPPNTEEKKAKFGPWWSKHSDTGEATKKLKGVMEELSKHEHIKKWGVIGYCWGGKVVSLNSQSGTPFSVAAEVHPAMVDSKDAEKVTIPLIMLGSEEEKEEDVRAFEKELKHDKHVEIFGDQVHGWMAARADLNDERVKSEYARGYKLVLDFFHKHL